MLRKNRSLNRPQPENITTAKHPVIVGKKEPTSAETLATPEKESKSDIDARVHTFLSEWKTAWEMSAGDKGDITKYISLYSDDFKSGGLDKKGWASDKSRKNKRKKWIRIELRDIRISDPDKNNKIEVSFSQDYRSSNFSVVSDKKLLLKKAGNSWVICSEQSD